jgi:protein-S-isoprenylcysteine O-methyltransferase Ste14
MAAGGGLIFAWSLLYFGWRYAVGFGDAAGASGPLAPAVADVLLFTVFALHHSAFARSGLKDAVTRFVPPALERSTYVWIASLLFIAVCAVWQPVPGVVWHASGGAAWLLQGVQVLAAVFTVLAARHLDILDLSGVRQALGLASSRPMKIDDYGPYGLVRHPIYLAWLLMVWPAPFMNGTRFVFAATSTLYLVAAIPFEERDLRRTFGDAYTKYANKVRFKILPGLY